MTGEIEIECMFERMNEYLQVRICKILYTLFETYKNCLPKLCIVYNSEPQ